jgi:hypothetical protein
VSQFSDYKQYIRLFWLIFNRLLQLPLCNVYWNIKHCYQVSPRIMSWTEKRVRKFYILLTAHLGIILVNDQPDKQFFFLTCLFQSCTCLEQTRAHDQLYE